MSQKSNPKSEGDPNDDSSIGSSVVVLSDIPDDMSGSSSDSSSLNDERSKSDDASPIEEMKSEADDNTRFQQRESRMEVITDNLTDDLPNSSSINQTENWIINNTVPLEKRRRCSSEPFPLSSSFFWHPQALLAATQNRQPRKSRTQYTDEVLEQVFSEILNNLEAYQNECEKVSAAQRYNLMQTTKLQERVNDLEVDADQRRQWDLQNRILIINVPTKLHPNELKNLTLRIAEYVGVRLDVYDIADIYYLFKKPCSSSPVVVIFNDEALGVREIILSRKRSLQFIPITLFGFPFTRYGNKISVDEQLTLKRNKIKQRGRMEVKKGNLVDCWVCYGNVYVRDNNQRKHKVNTEQNLEFILGTDSDSEGQSSV